MDLAVWNGPLGLSCAGYISIEYFFFIGFKSFEVVHHSMDRVVHFQLGAKGKSSALITAINSKNRRFIASYLCYTTSAC